MNRIQQLFKKKQENVCSVFVTAGYPKLESTVDVVLDLEAAGVDMIEIGMPFSDPLADGPTIQKSSLQALKNGMNIPLLFEQIEEIRKTSQIPIVLMGYINPVMAYGLETFLEKCKNVGVDGLIIPDISLETYELEYKNLFTQYGVPLTFLVTPRTTLNRIIRIQNNTETFIYYVSSSATTGRSSNFTEQQESAFLQFNELKLTVPVLAGFGIHNQETFHTVCKYFNGGIIGSAFLRSLEKGQSVKSFVSSLI